MNRAVSEELQRIGVSQAQAESIADDLSGNDARTLLSELLQRGLWSLVIDESSPSKLPVLGGDAVRRLLDKGVDVDDLMDVVRETQVDMIYSVANLIDWPTYELELEEPSGLTMFVGLQESGENALPIHDLHSCLMSRDPSGRHGEPRAIEVRQFQKLGEDEQENILDLLQERKLSAAALLWKKCIGGELKECMKAVQVLHEQLT
ncbi:hypothetical protein [Pseudoduganella sp. R-34]|uniref:hypothetical protein n=1 Tax=Pseudoduganella sp. R-34 TaxID=3404062 RepID=UPI003CF498E4